MRSAKYELVARTSGELTEYMVRTTKTSKTYNGFFPQTPKVYEMYYMFVRYHPTRDLLGNGPGYVVARNSFDYMVTCDTAQEAKAYVQSLFELEYND